MPFTREEFIDYVTDFYGPGGLYPVNEVGATPEAIAAATDKMIAAYKTPNVAFDSIDRETVLFNMTGVRAYPPSVS